MSTMKNDITCMLTHPHPQHDWYHYVKEGFVDQASTKYWPHRMLLAIWSKEKIDGVDGNNHKQPVSP